MSSSLGFLAYVLREPERTAATRTRIEHSRQHLASRFAAPLSITWAGDASSGFVGFNPEDYAIDWDRYSIKDGSGLAWLHVPSLAGTPHDGMDEWELADAVFSGRIKPSELGCPFAVIRWSEGQLEIINDVYGLVRLFHYEFDGGDVWSTRMGLAHVFMGEKPKRNALAWGGMAALGWAPGGSTQLGFGWQLAGGSRVRAGYTEAGRFVTSHRSFGEWLDSARSGPEPLPATNVKDMVKLMSTAQRWPTPAVSDLSGGRDSRVIAAMGIRSGSISAVRTLPTDHGEVETAKTLMGSITTDVAHTIVASKGTRPASTSNVLERMASQHASFEGRYLPTSAFNASAFAGYRTSKQAKFNGLGGEVMNGGAFTPARLRDKLDVSPASAASDTIISIIALGKGASDQSRELVADFAGNFATSMRDHTGVNTASGIMDLFYSSDRMPHWSNVFAGTDTICPLFAPSVLTIGARNVGSPVPDGELHTKFLAEAIPEWTQVPFYKPVGRAKRVLPMAWEREDWPDLRQFIVDNADSLEAFSADGLRSLLGVIDSGEGVKAHEVAVHRFLWNTTFQAYEDDIAATAALVHQAVLEAGHSEPASSDAGA